MDAAENVSTAESDYQATPPAKEKKKRARKEKTPKAVETPKAEKKPAVAAFVSAFLLKMHILSP